MLPVETTTAPYTKVLETEDFVVEFKKAATVILRTCQREDIFLDNVGNPIDICDGIFLINHLAARECWPDLIRKIFIQCFMAGENVVASSGIFACYALAQMSIFNYSNFEFSKLAHHSRLTGEKNAKLLIRQLLDNSSAKLFLKTIDHVGTSGQINISAGSKTTVGLEIFSGHRFNVGIAHGFCMQEIRREHGQLLLVDGAIESVGEIDHVLQHCHKNKSTALIVARRFGDDVISTLNLNFQRKTLDVIPIVATDEISSLNVFSDLAITTNSNVINDQSGQTTVGSQPSEMKIIVGIKCSHKSLSFNSHKASSRNVKKRIAELKERIHHETICGVMNDEDIRIFLSGRINSLSADCATLWLPVDSKKNGLYEFASTRFKFALGILDGLCKTGIIRIDDLKMGDIFSGLNVDFLPANVLIHSLLVAENITNGISRAGQYIVIDPDAGPNSIADKRV